MSRPSHQWDTSAVKHMKIEEEANTSAASFPHVIDPHEAERCIEQLKKFDLGEVGSSAWMEQHRVIERLNMQAHQNAMSNSDEYIMETVLTFSKIDVLFHDLLVLEAWKENIYPLLVDDIAGKNNMRVYFILYHEATIVNMLEVFFYYKHFLEAGAEKLLDITDYLGRKLVRLNNLRDKFREMDVQEFLSAKNPEAAKEYATILASRSPKDDLQQQWLDIEFRTCVTCVSLARYLSEHADILPLSVTSRIADTHDYLLLMIPLIENPPWTRRLATGKWQKLINQKWSTVDPIDLMKVTKVEGQPWIALYQLLAKEVFRQRYMLNNFRKGQLLRVRKYINELLLDQLPFLADIQRYMDELAVANVPDASNSDNIFLFQQVALITESIVKGKDFQTIAKQQLEDVFTMTDRTDKDLREMAELYADDSVEHILDPSAP